jgi:type VI secretion system (T6SS) effector TldE1-like protein
LISAGIAVLAIGFALGLPTVPPGLSVFESIQPKNFEPWASLESPHDGRRLHVASLETAAVFEFTIQHGDRQLELTASPSAEDLAIDPRAASFDERFPGAVNTPSSPSTAGPQERANQILLASPDLAGNAEVGRAVGHSALGLAPLPTLAPASVSKRPLRLAEAAAPDDSISLPDADAHTSIYDDAHTAIYDIVAHRVYLPSGQRLEAHSGLGKFLDDPRHVSQKDRGPTPPNVYDLSPREKPFHRVRAIRLVPVGVGNMFGRDGMLAHSYMRGRTGQSNGCVSFSNYPTFLNAVLSGQINRLVVVEHLATMPSPKSASGWLPESIKALFGRT